MQLHINMDGKYKIPPISCFRPIVLLHAFHCSHAPIRLYLHVWMWWFLFAFTFMSFIFIYYSLALPLHGWYFQFILIPFIFLRPLVVGHIFSILFSPLFFPTIAFEIHIKCLLYGYGPLSPLSEINCIIYHFLRSIFSALISLYLASLNRAPSPFILKMRKFIVFYLFVCF